MAEAPSDTEADQDERTRALWIWLDKITVLVDQRVLDLMERALGEPMQLPPRRREAASVEASTELAAGESGKQEVGEAKE